MVVIVGVGCATKAEKAKTNIAQTWKIFKVYQNDQDITSTYTATHINYRLTLDNDGGFNESYYPESGGQLVEVTGSWLFTDGIRKVTLTDGNQTRIFQIDQLDKDNFNITDLSANSNGRRFELIAD